MSSLKHSLVWPMLAFGVSAAAALGWITWDVARQTRELQRSVAEVRDDSALAFRLRQVTGDAQRLVVSYAFRHDERLLQTLGESQAEVARTSERIATRARAGRGQQIWTQLSVALDARAVSQLSLIHI